MGNLQIWFCSNYLLTYSSFVLVCFLFYFNFCFTYLQTLLERDIRYFSVSRMNEFGKVLQQSLFVCRDFSLSLLFLSVKGLVVFPHIAEGCTDLTCQAVHTVVLKTGRILQKLLWIAFKHLIYALLWTDEGFRIRVFQQIWTVCSAQVTCSQTWAPKQTLLETEASV